MQRGTSSFASSPPCALSHRNDSIDDNDVNDGSVRMNSVDYDAFVFWLRQQHTTAQHEYQNASEGAQYDVADRYHRLWQRQRASIDMRHCGCESASTEGNCAAGSGSVAGAGAGAGASSVLVPLIFILPR